MKTKDIVALELESEILRAKVEDLQNELRYSRRADQVLVLRRRDAKDTDTSGTSRGQYLSHPVSRVWKADGGG